MLRLWARTLVGSMAVITLSGCATLEHLANSGQSQSIARQPAEALAAGHPEVAPPAIASPVKRRTIADNDRRSAPPPLQLMNHAGPGATMLAEPLPPVDRSVWNRMRAQFALPMSDEKRVTAELDWYRSHPDYIHRVATRARPYLRYIVDEVEARGVPGELALLPVVESAFNVFAYSPGRAAGIWQFIPATGRRYGLKQNWWYDGRRDIHAATNGALNYLQQLNERFEGDWLHALGAYNAGAGNISKAIRKNRKRDRAIDFWHLDVPRETRSYVPKLIALSMVVRNPAAYGVTLEVIPDRQVFAQVETHGQIDLAVAAELAELSMDELYMFNPGFNRWATDPDGPHYLLLPVSRITGFERRLRELPEESRVAWQRHKIKSGESLSVIADRYGTTITHLRNINNLKSDLIRAGRHLLVPHAVKGGNAYALSAEQRRKRAQRKTRSGDRLDYRVVEGDTLWDLAVRFGISSRSIAKWNGMSVRDPIRPGQLLVLWLPRANSAALPPRDGLSGKHALQKIQYTVRPGDSLSVIASRFRVTVADLKRWNPSRLRGRYLQPGQRLRVYVDVRHQSG